MLESKKEKDTQKHNVHSFVLIVVLKKFSYFVSQDMQHQGHMLSGTTRGHHHITLVSQLQICAAVSIRLLLCQKVVMCLLVILLWHTGKLCFQITPVL